MIVDNVKWTDQNGLFTMPEVRPLDGGNYFAKAFNETGDQRLRKDVYVIPIVAPLTG